jgi:thiol-disulfide isomerase/thioredoxin
MKKLIIILAAIVMCLFHGCAKSDQMTIKGRIDNYDGSTVTALDALAFGTKEVPVDKQGNFSFSYYAGEKHEAMIIYRKAMAVLLAENGVTEVIRFTADSTGNVVFSGDNKSENRYLTELNGIYKVGAGPADEDSEDSGALHCPFSEYNAALDSTAAALSGILASCKDREFASEQDSALKRTVLERKNRFMEGLEPADSDPDFNAYMKGINVNGMDDAKNGQTRQRFKWISRIKGISEEDFSAGYLTFLRDSVANQDVKDYLATEEMNDLFMMPDKVTKEIFDLYNNICENKSDKDSIGAKFGQLSSLLKGNPAPDFEMKGTDGKTAKLSDFRGKTVYVDCWASWCEPCCEEIPYLAKLVERFKGNDKVVFISVSFDSKDENWRTALDKFKPTWKQYIAGDSGKDIGKKYMISGIPQFILVDKAGNLISFNAPRPSDEALYDIISRNL